jgi:hypothetical protein
VLDPLRWFQQSLQHVGDPEYVAAALEWILSRVELYQNYPRYTSDTFDIDDPLNLFHLFFLNIQYAWRYGNLQMLETMVDAALRLFQVVAVVLRSDIGLNFSKRLLNDYCEAARRLLPWISSHDPQTTFDVLRSAYELSGQDRSVIRHLCQVLGPGERGAAYNSAYNAALYGDLLALRIAPYI